MNTTLTLDQRVNRGIKKVKESFLDKELNLVRAIFTRKKEYSEVGFGSASEIDYIDILCQEFESKSTFGYSTIESNEAGVFLEPYIQNPQLISFSPLNNSWPLPYSIEEYLDVYFSLHSDRIEIMELLYNPNYEHYFNPCSNGGDYLCQITTVNGDLYIINCKSKKFCTSTLI